MLKNILILFILLISVSNLKASESLNIDLYYNGMIEPNKALILIKKLNELSLSKKEINIEINSSGGDIASMGQIIFTINQLKKQDININIIVKEKCYSACFTILQVVNKRMMYSDAKLMQHMPLSLVNVLFYYNGKDKQKRIKEFEQILDDKYNRVLTLKSAMEDIELNRINLSREKWRELTINDYYMNSKESLTINAIDVIIIKGDINEKTK